MDERAIGVYDSGIGGTTVFRELNKILSEENYIYFGDTKNLPYGTKTKKELLAISGRIFDFFAEKKVKAVVMACNTTSSMVYDEMKDKYDYEIYPLIQTAAKSIASRCDGKIGVLATTATIASNKYRDELLKNNPDLEVVQKACPEWVRIVESGDYYSEKNLKIIKADFMPVLESGCKNVILGCTHYPYLEGVLSEISNQEVNFINPAKDFTEFIANDLRQKNLFASKRTNSPVFYVSSDAENFMRASKMFYQLDKLPQVVTF